jgi:hypothetical protein
MQLSVNKMVTQQVEIPDREILDAAVKILNRVTGFDGRWIDEMKELCWEEHTSHSWTNSRPATPEEFSVYNQLQVALSLIKSIKV